MAHDKRDDSNPRCDGGRYRPVGGVVVLEAKLTPRPTGAGGQEWEARARAAAVDVGKAAAQHET